MSKYFDEELSECIAAKAQQRVISKEIAMRIAATWHTPANRLVSFSTAGIVMREMVDIVSADMRDMCLTPDHFDADDSVKDLGTVPQNLVMLYALREFFESECTTLRYQEIDLESFGDAILDEWSDGRAELRSWLEGWPYGDTIVYSSIEAAEEAIVSHIADLIAFEAKEEEEAENLLAEDRAFAQNEYKHG